MLLLILFFYVLACNPRFPSLYSNIYYPPVTNRFMFSWRGKAVITEINPSKDLQTADPETN